MVVVVVVAVLSGSEEVCGEDPRSSFLVVMTALFDRVYSIVMFAQWVVPSAMLLWLSGFEAEVSSDMLGRNGIQLGLQWKQRIFPTVKLQLI